MLIHQLTQTRIAHYFVQRLQMWQLLQRIQPHPISKHIQRQLYKKTQLPILAITLVWGCVVFLTTITLFTNFNTLVLMFLPLGTLVFSSGYIVPWLYRIAKEIKRQYHNSVIDTIGVVPNGQMFIMLVICHAVLNEGDRLGWIQISRNTIVAIITTGILVATMVTASIVESVVFLDLALMLSNIAALSLLLYAEHQQSVMIGCYIAMILPYHMQHSGNLVSSTIIYFVFVQFLTAVIPMIVVVGLAGNTNTVPLFLLNSILFLLIREMIIFGFLRVAQRFG